MLDAHVNVIPPDALYAVSYSSPPPCIPTNWAAFELPPGAATPPERTGLERGKGPWRDPGFWLRLVSPGGTQRLRRRGHPPGGKPPGTATLPRGLKCSSEGGGGGALVGTGATLTRNLGWTGGGSPPSWWHRVLSPRKASPLYKQWSQGAILEWVGNASFFFHILWW